MWKPSRPILALGAACAVATFVVVGAVTKDRSLFGQTVAAWAQAIFAAAAVFAAAWLQERFLRRQTQDQHRQRIENVASAARWVLQTYERIHQAVDGRNLSLRDFANLDGQGAFATAAKVLAELKLGDLDDHELATVVLTLQGVIADISAKREEQLEIAKRAPSPIVTERWLKQDYVMVFNAASAVERLAARAVGRKAAF
ncbi:hypothetical protein CFHF_24900 [Caulobacter flavus]|uniref:Uncharacterized protein n=1 Tax=Caulobacter flavus TaxID=1679497 RepID=A0A2N5CL23_9CAUL|nr:hypothetical protein C1707_19530 [Caulobacter flavus]PLR06436.1 hypothetical protein CFHF_24900 [Caulobacter flavus]